MKLALPDALALKTLGLNVVLPEGILLRKLLLLLTATGEMLADGYWLPEMEGSGDAAAREES